MVMKVQTQRESNPLPGGQLLGPNRLAQRKCVCGSHATHGGECAKCANKNSGLQTKLAIGARNDPLEWEADRVADQVLATSSFPAVKIAPPAIQRLSGYLNSRIAVAPASVDRVLAGPGRPLQPGLRLDMEQRFGHDFSGVRVHSGAAAERSVSDVNAHAYTVGQDIVFGSGRFAPETQQGRRLIAHELTHVVQQSGSDGSHLVHSDDNGWEFAAPAARQTKAPGTPLLQGFWAELGGAIVGAAAGALAFASGGLGGIIAGLAVGGLFGGLGGHFLSKLFGGKEEDIDKTEPTDEGIKINDPDFWKTWEKFIAEGSSRLKSGGCRFPYGNSAWKYDSRYWERTDDPNYVAFKPKGVSPAKALDELFNNPSLWELDCALHPEVVQLYAFRRTLGAARFNEKFKDMILRQHRSKGLQTEFHDVNNDGEAVFNTLWNDAPPGSKVMWTNRSPTTLGTAWNHENGIKRSKGAIWEEDKYDAHPLGTNLLEKEVKKSFAENAADYPESGSDSEKTHYVDEKIYRHQLHLIVRT